MHGPTPDPGMDHRADGRSGGRTVDRLRREQAMEIQREREPRKGQRRQSRTAGRRQPAMPVVPVIQAAEDR